MNEPLQDAQIGTYIARAQLVNSALLKYAANIIPKNEPTLVSLERVNSIVCLQTLEIKRFVLKSWLDLWHISSRYCDIVDDIKLLLSIYEARDIYCLRQRYSDKQVRSYAEWCFQKVCLENQRVEKIRKSDVPFSLGYDQFGTLGKLVSAAEYLSKTGIHYTQQMASCVGHLSFILYAVRASDIIFEQFAKRPEIFLYADLDYAANNEMIKTMVDSGKISVRSCFDQRQKFCFGIDYQWDYLCHQVINSIGVRTHYSQLKINLSNKTKTLPRISLGVPNKKVLDCANSEKSVEPRHFKIGLHIREFGYKRQKHLGHRDTDAQWMLNIVNSSLQIIAQKHSLAFTVFRFGVGNVEIKLPRLGRVRFHDVYHDTLSGKSKEFECYLIDNIDCMIGTSSGPSHITHWLGIPTAFMEATTIGHSLELIDSNSILSLKRLIPKECAMNHSRSERVRRLFSDWSSIGDIAEVAPNDKECIQQTLIEFMEKTLLPNYRRLSSFKRLSEALGDDRHYADIDDITIDQCTFRNIRHFLGGKCGKL
jgi:hypothetical protein